MKKEFYFYKNWYAGFRLKDLIPKVSFSENVQGWFYTRVYTLKWFTYAISLFLIKTRCLDQEREIAHEKNVQYYLK
jgi:hypothetical protein